MYIMWNPTGSSLHYESKKKPYRIDSAYTSPRENAHDVYISSL